MCAGSKGRTRDRDKGGSELHFSMNIGMLIIAYKQFLFRTSGNKVKSEGSRIYQIQNVVYNIKMP